MRIVKLLPLALGILLSVQAWATEPRWVIMPDVQFRASGPERRLWMPSPEQVPDFDTAVRSYVEHQAKEAKHDLHKRQFAYILSHWDSYACQVTGEISEQTQVVVLSFFPRDYRAQDGFDWRTTKVSVKGGGASFFYVSYDPVGKVFRSIWINSPR